MNLAVVVIAYNRPKSLLNLLNSLATAFAASKYSMDIINCDTIYRYEWN